MKTKLGYTDRHAVAGISASLPEKEWREFVLSPWIDGADADITWRRELWEWMAPRVRRETDAEQAAQIVARELRRRVSLQSESLSHGIAASWAGAAADVGCLDRMYVAALRSAGVPSRLANGRVELLVGERWQSAPNGTLQKAEIRN